MNPANAAVIPGARCSWYGRAVVADKSDKETDRMDQRAKEFYNPFRSPYPKKITTTTTPEPFK